MPITHNHVARLLDRSRPFGYDSELFRQCATNRSTTAADLQTLLDEAVLPTADPSQVYHSVSYRDGNSEQSSSMYFILTARRIGELILGISAVYTVPYVCDGIDTPVTCEIESDQLGTTLTCSYESSETASQRRRTYVEPKDIAQLSNAITQLTGSMVAERCALQ